MNIIMDKEVARLLEKFRSGRITSEELQKLKIPDGNYLRSGTERYPYV